MGVCRLNGLPRRARQRFRSVLQVASAICLWIAAPLRQNMLRLMTFLNWMSSTTALRSFWAHSLQRMLWLGVGEIRSSDVLYRHLLPRHLKHGESQVSSSAYMLKSKPPRADDEVSVD